MIVDGETLRPRQRDRAPARRTSPDGEIKPELMESVLEIATNPCADTAEAGDAAARAAPQRARTRGEPRPDDRLGRHASVRAVGGPADRRARTRYRDLISALRFVARQELIFGMHVHVGVDDPDKAIHVANGMRVHLPGAARAERELAVLARRTRTGLLSTRTPIFRAFPRVGVPPAYRDWEDYSAQIEFMVASGVMEDYTYLWYDVRPHPRLGHRRDAGVRLADARRAHARARRAHPGDGHASCASTSSRASRFGDYPWQMLDENKWLAARHGLDGELVDLPVERAGARRRRSRAGCSTACASTRRTSDRPPSSTASTDLLERGQRRGAPDRRLRGQPRLRRRSWREIVGATVRATASSAERPA